MQCMQEVKSWSVACRTAQWQHQCAVTSCKTHWKWTLFNVPGALHTCLLCPVQGLYHPIAALPPLLFAMCEGWSLFLPGKMSICQPSPAYSLLGYHLGLFEWFPGHGTPHPGRYQSASILHPVGDWELQVGLEGQNSPLTKQCIDLTVNPEQCTWWVMQNM